MIDNTNRKIHIPFKACEGEQYVFASYAHDDKDTVFPMLEKLYCAGYNVWYDEGIDIDEKYNRVITSHVENCEVVVLFISNLSMSRPYVVDIEFDFAVRLGKKIIPVYLEDVDKLPSEVNAFLHGERHDSIDEVIALLNKTGIKNFGVRKAEGLTREVATGWFDDIESEKQEASSSERKGIVGCEETPYAYVSLVPEDLTVCHLILKELFNAGYNIRSCENGTDHDRAMMLASPNCKAIIAIVAEGYVKSGVIDRDFELAHECDKKFITLMLDKSSPLPSRFDMMRGGNQGLCIWEYDINDYVSKIEEELEDCDCCIRDADGNVTRRLYNIPGFWYEYNEKENVIEITKYVGKNADVVIQPSYYSWPVRYICSKAFSKCEHISSIDIPDTVTDIGDFAFAYCTKLKSISIPSSVKKIGAFAFYGCRNMVSLSLLNSEISIGLGAFDECKGLAVYRSGGIEPASYYARENASQNSSSMLDEEPIVVADNLLNLYVPFPADEEPPYIFVSYSHQEREFVFPVIRKLYEMGWKIWYDQGIDINTDYHLTIANHINDSSAVVFFVDKHSASHSFSEIEINYAIRRRKKVILCILDSKAELSSGLKMLTVNHPITSIDGLPGVLERIDGLTIGAPRKANGVQIIEELDHNTENSEPTTLIDTYGNISTHISDNMNILAKTQKKNGTGLFLSLLLSFYSQVARQFSSLVFLTLSVGLEISWVDATVIV